MATQTPTQRSAAAKRAAATRKRNAAKRSAADAVRRSALTYTNSRRLARQLDQFERRGARALARSGRKVRSRVR